VSEESCARSAFPPGQILLIIETTKLTPSQRKGLHFYRAYLCRDQIIVSKTIFRGRLLKALSGSISDNRIYTRHAARESCFRTGKPVRNGAGALKPPYLENKPNFFDINLLNLKGKALYLFWVCLGLFWPFKPNSSQIIPLSAAAKAQSG
jgi:hypothetical protein